MLKFTDVRSRGYKSVSKCLPILCLLIASVCLPVPTAMARQSVPPPPPDRPQIEVCFVLDTTGSMSGLIEGAKQKIWSIANEIISAKPTPRLKIGLIGYRDRSDDYVTKTYSLTDDLDDVYAKLNAFSAGGGGDTPESVNQALNEAVTQMSWSKSREVLKIIFLVGDAPPHMDYQDDVKYQKTCKLAAESDLIINTVQCGNITATTPIWKEIARLAEGSYVAIGQSGNMVRISTPHDEELAKLQRELNGTVVLYGSESRRQSNHRKLEMGVDADRLEATAARASVLAKTKAGVVTGEGDLVTEYAEGSVKLADLKADDLPVEMKEMGTEEIKAYVEKQSAQRKELEKKIAQKVKQRDAYIAEQRKKQAESGEKDSFDVHVTKMIREQAGRKGISYAD